MDSVVILVPRRADNGVRDELWRFARTWWAGLFPDWPIVEGHHNDGPFNRSAAINRAADLAGDWSVAVIIDSDVLPDRAAIFAAVAVARSGQPALGFNRRRHLTRSGTARVMAGDRGDWSKFVKQDLGNSVSGAFVIGRDLWDQVGGFDEGFRGWGWEDVAFKLAVETMSDIPVARIAGDLWHLWHPHSPERDQRTPEFVANKERGDRYKRARRDRSAMARLLAENPRQHVAPYEPLQTRTRGIPRILHRTIPEHPNPEVETWWATATELHPGWEHRTHQDPLDPAEWETAALWDLCQSGAQKAGLIRLEALWRFGGIYVDSDVEVYRSFEPLRGLEMFAGWEDPRVVPDAVLGARPGHPAVAAMLADAAARVRAGEGAWATGPGVTTRHLPGRSDVALLPPGSLYPYHYTERHREPENHAEQQPWAFCAHHWRHSWRGK